MVEVFFPPLWKLLELEEGAPQAAATLEEVAGSYAGHAAEEVVGSAELVVVSGQ